MFEVDYEKIIKEKFPNCDVEVLTVDIFELDKLLEYITDDIVIYNPESISVHRHLMKFVVNDDKCKIYYLKDFSDDNLKVIYGVLLDFAWNLDVKINLHKNANPDKDILNL